MDIKNILKNQKCSTCGNLGYFDWYFCKIGKHTTKKGFLHMGKLKKCDGYIKRVGKNWDSCKGQECVFWCQKCPAYPKRNKKTEIYETK